MRVLLDENLPHTLRQLFENPTEVITVETVPNFLKEFLCFL